VTSPFGAGTTAAGAGLAATMLLLLAKGSENPPNGSELPKGSEEEEEVAEVLLPKPKTLAEALTGLAGEEELNGSLRCVVWYGIVSC
jgi:hypothetical protein